MNTVQLIGNLTRDPQGGKTQTGLTWCRFTIAVDRPKSANGEQITDYPTICCLGKVAENVLAYKKKGDPVGIIGTLQTGSYDKDGQTIYTTEVFANRVEFLQRKEGGGQGAPNQVPAQNQGYGPAQGAPQQNAGYGAAPAPNQGFANAQQPAPAQQQVQQAFEPVYENEDF